MLKWYVICLWVLSGLLAAEESLKTALPSLPQRIVSQTLATDEILLAICDPKRLIALSIFSDDPHYSNVVEQAKHIPHQVQDNVESILALHPDLIFVASYSRAETVSLLEAAQTPVVRLSRFESILDIEFNIQLIGQSIGEENRANQLIKKMKIDIQTIRDRIPTFSAPPRLISYSPGSYTAGAHTIFDDMVTVIKAINLAKEKGIQQHAKISDEQILAWQPDFIVTHAKIGDWKQTRRKLLENPAIAATRAAQENRIIFIDTRYFVSASQYVILGIEALAKEIYPQLQTKGP